MLHEIKHGMKTVDDLKQEVMATGLPQETKELFYRVLETADVGSLSEKDRMKYETDLKNYMDTMSCIEFAKYSGKQEGREEGKAKGKHNEKLAIANSMKSKSIDTAVILECTGLSIEKIENL